MKVIFRRTRKTARRLATRLSGKTWVRTAGYEGPERRRPQMPFFGRCLEAGEAIVGEKAFKEMPEPKPEVVASVPKDRWRGSSYVIKDRRKKRAG